MIAERPTPNAGRPSLPADHPKAVLLRLLGDAEALVRLRQAADILAPNEPLAFLRLFFFEAGGMAPRATSVSEWVRAWIQWRAAAVPASLGPPQAGDMWVQTDGQRQPCVVGFVQKVSTDGRWFYAIDGHGPDRYRLEVGEVDYWLRLPVG
jgi:hypothetical protein